MNKILSIICYFFGHKWEFMEPCENCKRSSLQCRVCGKIDGRCNGQCMVTMLNKLMAKASIAVSKKVEDELNEMLDINEDDEMMDDEHNGF